jgi:hypothetical protein
MPPVRPITFIPPSLAFGSYVVKNVTLPLYPPPFDKGGGISFIREASPLFNFLFMLSYVEVLGKDDLSISASY